MGLSAKDYGYRNLTELIKAIDLFDTKNDDGTHYFKDPTIKVAKHISAKTVKSENLESENLESENPATHDITDELLSLLSDLPDDDDDDLNKAVRHAINALSPDGDWVRASSVSDFLRRQYGVKVSDLGFHTFAELFSELDGIECQKQGRILLIR